MNRRRDRGYCHPFPSLRLLHGRLHTLAPHRLDVVRFGVWSSCGGCEGLCVLWVVARILVVFEVFVGRVWRWYEGQVLGGLSPSRNRNHYVVEKAAVEVSRTTCRVLWWLSQSCR